MNGIRLCLDPEEVIAKGKDFARTIKTKLKAENSDLSAIEVMLGYICTRLDIIDDNTWENASSLEEFKNSLLELGSNVKFK